MGVVAEQSHEKAAVGDVNFHPVVPLVLVREDLAMHDVLVVVRETADYIFVAAGRVICPNCVIVASGGGGAGERERIGKDKRDLVALVNGIN